MSLDLHAQCVARLSEAIAAALENVTVYHQTFLDRASVRPLEAADTVVPQTGKTRDALRAYIGDSPVFDFIYETLSRELYETQEYDSEKVNSKLIDLEGYGDLRAVAGRLVGEFNSLPWQYALTIPLPGEVGEVLGKKRNYMISNALRVITPDDEFSREYPLTSGIGARDRRLFPPAQNLFRLASTSAVAGLLGNLGPQWETGVAHLQIHVEGFIGMFGTTVCEEDSVDWMKEFFGVAMALRLLRVERSFGGSAAKSSFYVHRKVGDRWIIERMLELDTPLSEAVRDLVLDDFDGRVTAGPDQEAWVERVIKRINCAFSHQPRSRRVLLAGQWLFDSQCGTNELLSFVQTAVAMEILLGEKAASDLMGLGELLRNRCAYLISGTVEEREMVLRDFKSVYDVRCKIVHEGKKRLDSKDRALFYKLRWMCRRVIQKETELFEKEGNADA